jgi:LTXXQ motif family protein
MKARIPRRIVPVLLAAAIPTFALAQQGQVPAQPPAKSETGARPAQLSPEALARLQDGRMAMIKETLKLDQAQLKLWAPVEAQIRASAVAREQARAQRRQLRQQTAQRPPLPDRLDRASQNMAKRAEGMKAFAEVFRPFYASLSDDQKALAGVVLREARGKRGPRGHAHRWAMHRAPGAPQQ